MHEACLQESLLSPFSDCGRWDYQILGCDCARSKMNIDDTCDTINNEGYRNTTRRRRVLEAAEKYIGSAGIV